MMTLQEIIEAARALPSGDRETLRLMLGVWRERPPGTLTREEEGVWLMHAKGLVSRVAPPISDLVPYQDRESVAIEGKPLSETVIEERR